MKQVYSVLKFLWNRPLRNVYFWAMMIYIVMNNDVSSRVYAPSVYYMGAAITTSILIVFTYTNNLWLMPMYMRTKRYRHYLLGAALLVLLSSVLFIESVRVFMQHYPKVSIHHISVFSTPVGIERTWSAWLYELWWCCGGMVLWMFIMSTAWYMNDYARQQKQLEDAQQKQVEAELSFLKNQVNPHFLFNTLNNLYGLALKKADRAPDAILRLSSILRYMLYESNSERVSFEKEKEIMQAYIDLEMLRLPNSNNCTFTIQNDRDYLVPPLLWMPVLENVFKHGTRMITDDYYINYSVHVSDNVLSIHSSNRFKSSDNNGNGGIGLSNLRKRLALLYPGKYRIDAAAEGDVYNITIQIQL